MELKPKPGTMKLHAVFIDEGNVYTAETSCYCQECLTGLESNRCQATWTLVKRRETDNPNVPENMETGDQMTREFQIVIEDLKLIIIINLLLPDMKISGTFGKSKTLISVTTHYI